MFLCLGFGELPDRRTKNGFFMLIHKSIAYILS